MLDLIRHDLGLPGIHHDIFASEAQVQGSGAANRVEATLRDKGLVYEGLLEAPKGETPEDWEPVELNLFRSTELGDDQARPVMKTAGDWDYYGHDARQHNPKAGSTKP